MNGTPVNSSGKKGCGLLNHAHQIFFAHHQVLDALDLHGLTRVLAEEDLVALLHVERADLAVFEDLAGSHRDDLASVWLLGGGVRDHDARGGLSLFLEALHDHAVMQGADFHRSVSLTKSLID